jgi:transcriptional regulator with XRE-family HTH domain
MKFVITQEWLAKTLERCGDDCIAVGGTHINDFKKEMELRTVTPAVFRNVPTQLGKVVRFIREQKGWSITEMAELADIDESDLSSIETMSSYDPSPRTVVRLADVCHFKRDEFVRFANHRTGVAANDSSVRFAASSGKTDSISEDEYDAIRALVEVLTQHA